LFQDIGGGHLIEQQELTGRCGEDEVFLAFGDPPEAAGVHFESLSDGLGFGYIEVVGQEQALAGSSGGGEQGTM
jgi:hypothetical protein